MSTFRSSGIFVSVLWFALAASPARAEEPFDQIAGHLVDLTNRLGDLASFGALDDPIPMTALSPTGNEGLGLANLFNGTLGSALVPAPADCAALETAIENAGGIFGGVTIAFTDVVCDDTTNAPRIDLSFKVNAFRLNVKLPISFADEDEPIDFEGGGMFVDFRLCSESAPCLLEFQFDPAGSDPQLALVTPPTLVISVNTNAEAPIEFFDEVGFVDVTVSLSTVLLDLDLEIKFSDPDGIGGLTRDEWTNTALADLVVVEFLEEEGDEVHIELTLESDLISGGPVASIVLQDDCLGNCDNIPGDPNSQDGLNAPTVTLSLLDAFTNIGPTEILSGLTLLAASMSAIEQISDIRLPFLSRSLGETFDFVKPLLAFIEQHSDAAIVCGTIDDDPPRGDISSLSSGAVFYCQALMSESPEVVQWLDTHNAMVVDFGSDVTTVGTNPIKNAKFQMTADGRPDVRFKFKEETSDTDFPHVSNLFSTAAQLLIQLNEGQCDGGADAGQSCDPAVPGQCESGVCGDGFFDLGKDDVHFDPATHSLTYRLKASFEPDLFGDAEDGSEDVLLDFVDSLQADTNLVGLNATGAAGATIDPGTVEVDIEFGVILVEDINDITPGDGPAEELDRFFVKVRPGDGQHEFQLSDALIEATVALEGRIGFLAVSVEGDSPGTGLVIARADESKPILAVDISGGEIVIQDAENISSAVLIGELLSNLSVYVPPENIDINIKVNGGLKVSAELSTTPLLEITGQVDIDWPDITTGSPDITTQTNFDELLKVFDTDPSIFGHHTGAAGASDLKDSTQDFRVGKCIGGDDSGARCVTDAECMANECRPNALGRTLRNLTDGSSCVVTEIIGTDALKCQLSGGIDNVWGPPVESGEGPDAYELEGNPFDLLSVILDNFDLLVQAIDGLKGCQEADPGDCEPNEVDKVFGTKLPLIGVSPEDLLGFLDDLENAVDNIRMGQPQATVVCTWDAPDPDGDGVPDQDPTNLVGLPGGASVFCRLQAGEATSVQWEIDYLIEESSSDANDGDEDVNTVGAVPRCIGGPNAGDYCLRDADCPDELNEDGEVVEMGDCPEDGLALATFILVCPAGNPECRLNIGRDFAIKAGGTTADSGDFRARLPVEPFSLQALERLMESELGIPEEALALELVDLGGDGVKDLVIRLGFCECTRDNAVIDCLPADREVDQKELRFNLGLEDMGLAGIVGIEQGEETVLKLEYAARARLDIAIPLDPDFDSDLVRIVDTSKIELFADARVEDLNIAVNIGPLSAQAEGQAKLGIEFSLLPVGGDAACSNETMSIEEFVGCLVADLSGTGAANCGTIDKPVTLEGAHQGADDADGVNDPGEFGDVAIGDALRNITTGEDCTVTDTGADTVKCLDGDDMPIVSWDNGDLYEIDITKTITLDGDACAKLDVQVANVSIAEVGFRVEDLTDLPPDDLDTAEAWFFFAEEGLSDQFLISGLDLALLIEALKYLVSQLDAILEGGGPKLKLPLVGDRLDGGAGICEELGGTGGSGLEANGFLGELEALLDSLGDIPKTDELKEELYGVMVGAVGGLLRDTDGDDTIENGEDDVDQDIHVTLMCTGNTVCNNDDLIDLRDIRIRFLMGQGPMGDIVEGCDDPACNGTFTPFDLGIPGVPLGIEGTLESKAAWELLVDFGLSLEDGPYLISKGNNHGDEPELKVGVSVGFATEGADVCGNSDLPNGFPSQFTGAKITGKLAFLDVEFCDGAGSGEDQPNPTKLSLLSTLDITGPEKIGLAQLTGGGVGLDLTITADADADLSIHAGLGAPLGDKLPSILGAFELDWPIAEVKISTTDGSRFQFSAPEKLAFNDIYLDAGGFFSEFVGDALKDIRRATKPIDPVLDMVRAPIPLVSDLSELVGGPKITMFSLLKLAVNDPDDLRMIESLIELVEFIKGLPTEPSENPIWFPLGSGGNPGSFTIIGEEALAGPSTPDTASRLITGAIGRTDLFDAILEDGFNLQATDIPSSLTFPFLDDTSQIFGLLMGADATLIRYDAGTMRATAALGPFTYCCIPVGPVPVSVGIGGSVTLAGRFAAGYDTVGMRKVVEGGKAADLLDGLFIDDLDAQGKDVPEISLIGEVYASAAVNIGFAEAGLKGGITLTIDLNLDDRPEPDGKLRLDEIANKLSNPICLFEVSGRLEAFLRAYVRIGFSFFSKTWEFDILRITLLDFSAACTPPSPEPANVEGGILIVNVGARASKRRFNVEEIDEEVTVRQLNGAGTKFSVLLMGFVKDYPNVNIGPGEFAISIDAGIGNDLISLEAGTIVKESVAACEAEPGFVVGICTGDDDELCTSDDMDCPDGESCMLPTEGPVECIIPFTRKAHIIGGPEAVVEGETDDDQIKSGGGDDSLEGGYGNDKISGGAGDDTIQGGLGNDVLEGQAGNDDIDGGDDNDTISGGSDTCHCDADDNACIADKCRAGFGDTLKGGEGSDDINGGPGINTAEKPAPSGSNDPDADRFDGNDKIVGGLGSDTIQGFFGNDTIYGDEDGIDCDDAGTVSGSGDKIDCGPGDDTVFAGPGPDIVGGGEGNDTLCGNAGNDLLDGDSPDAGPCPGSCTPGDPSQTCAGDLDGDCIVDGGDDTLDGGEGHDLLLGRSGHDRLLGRDGNDALYGHEGPDDLIGGAGRDILFGGLGIDILLGDAGDGSGDENGDIDAHDAADHNIDEDENGVPDILEFIHQDNTGTADGEIVAECSVTLDWKACTTADDCGDGESCTLGLCFADLGPVLPADNAEPGSKSDCLFGAGESDFMFGEAGADTMFGDGSEGECEGTGCAAHRDYMEGNTGEDMMRGGIDNDRMFGNDDNDRMFGDSGADRMFGGKQDDMMRGGQDDDYMEGNEDNDTMFGDSGQDDMIGGSSTAGTPDGDDTMFGNTEQDVMAGDNATIERPGGSDNADCAEGGDCAVIRNVTLLDLACGDTNVGGIDTMHGNTGNDDMYGGCDNDIMHGDQGEDYLEGNGGSDTMFGNLGQDDLIGGTSAESEPEGGDRPVDAGDFICGGDGAAGLCEVNSSSDLEADHDVIAGDNASITRPLNGGQWIKDTFSVEAVDVVRRVVTLLDVATTDSTPAADTSGDDVINGEAGRDIIRGGGGGDDIHGHSGDDFIEGNDGADDIWGDQGQDDLVGGTGRTKSDDDSTAQDGRLDQGTDTIYGGQNGADLATDYDVIAGDNATIDRDPVGMCTAAGEPFACCTGEGSGTCGVAWITETFADPAGSDAQNVVRRVIELFDVGTTLVPAGSGSSDGDVINGEAGFDIIFGGGGDDDIHGNKGDDFIQGNDGADEIWGDEGQDDLIGGTGRTKSDDPDSAQDGRLDEGTAGVFDRIFGGSDAADLPDDYDVIVGDNATVDRELNTDSANSSLCTGAGEPYSCCTGSGSGTCAFWTINTFNASVKRNLRFYDVATVNPPAGLTNPPAGLMHPPAGLTESSLGAPIAPGGDDMLWGEGFADVMYGQGGNDTMSGGTGDDYMEGNDGDDIMDGNADHDDMVGGTGRINHTQGDDPENGTNGRLDGIDTMHGNDGFDVMAGDNAILVRVLVKGQWVTNTFNDGIQHEPRILLDLDSPETELVSAGDFMFGDEKDDLMYGQGGDDLMEGNDDEDIMEGNAGVDTMSGNAGQDDMIGGTVQAGLTDEGDIMSGNGQDDVMIGDNGTITRRLDLDGAWQDDLNTGGRIRDVVLFDVQTVGANVDLAFSGGDEMTGDDDDDQMFGQGGDDVMHGGNGFDYMEGNHADDEMHGDADEDDMIGGGSANDGVISRTSIGNGLLDGEDDMFGGDEGDVMSGDNSRIVRATGDDGIWRIDPNSDDVFREVVLFDVETVDGPAVDEDTSGSDLMLGEDGRDLMFGQGNTRTDDDGDGRFNEDPPDGLDNDRDGREGPDSEVYDCLDCRDNDDGDGAQDADDEQCVASIDEDGGGDEMHGGNGPDYMEGNHGSDWMLGDAAEDDMIGGSSAGDGVIGGGVPPTNLLDGDDTMTGGDEDDVMIGDNGTIVRSTDGPGIWLRHNSGPEPDDFDIVVRVVTMSVTPESDGAFGHDHMRGQGGHDDLYGQLGNDVMEGNDGEDALLGDLGRITGNIEDGSRQRIIMPPGPFFEELIFEAGTYNRSAELFSYEDGQNGGGNDVMLGGDGRDSLHGGPGDDFMNGDGGRSCNAPADDPIPETDDEDHLFGGDGNDVMWGGRGHDHLWGGHHEDYLDVRPRVASEVTIDDTPEWFTYGEPDHYQALDVIYGGWGRDGMQANVAEPGPPPADRLIDWAGGFNVFYVCPGAYGEGTITRQGSPHLREFLRDLAEADGALMPHVEGTSGFRELGYVFPKQRGANSHPPHPDHPGHFVCDDGEILFNEVSHPGGPDGPR